MEEERREQPEDFEELLRRERAYQSAFDKKVEKALQTARANWEREQAAARETERAQIRQAAMAEAEQAFAQRTAEQNERERQLDRRVRQMEAAELLTQRGLSPKFAPWLTGSTPEESRERVDAFQAAFQAGVAETVTARMAGAAPAEPTPSPAYDREVLRGMSPREINAHWAEIQNTLKGSV